MLFQTSGIAQEVTIKDTEKRSFHSAIVNTEFSLNIFLPRNYAKSNQDFPVVYILDAEYNFGMVSYATRRLIKDKLIPEVILVGIAYDTTYQWYTNSRQRDYTQTATRIPYTGGAKLFSILLKRNWSLLSNPIIKFLPIARLSDILLEDL